MPEPNSSTEPAAVESSASSVSANDNSASDNAAASGSTTDAPDSSMTPNDVVSETVAELSVPTWFRRGDQLFVGVMVIAVIVLMTVHWVRLSGWGL